MKTLLFSIGFTIASNFAYGYTSASDFATHKMYIHRNENGEFLLNTDESGISIKEIYQDKEGYFIYLEDLTPKAFKEAAYCPGCKKKFFSNENFRKHECENIYNR